MLNKHKISIATIWGLIFLRILLAFLPSFEVDMGAWLAWSFRLANEGFRNFYSENIWTQYTPGYLYWLWLVGKLGWISPLAIKLPMIAIDMFTATLIVQIIGGKYKYSWWIFVAYVLSPIVVWDSAIWGQIDGLLTLFMLLSVYFVVEKNNWGLGWICMAMAMLIKPQAIALFPALAVITFSRIGMGQLLMGISLTGLIQIVGYWPFFPVNTWGMIVDLWEKMSISYSYTSLYAFNMWGLIGMWQNDAQIWMGKSYAYWGMIVAGVIMAILLLKSWKLININKRYSYWLAMLSCWIFFLFPTRVHERYLFPAFAFGYILLGISNSRRILWLLVVTTVVYFLNLYLPYSSYEPNTNWLTSDAIEVFLNKSSRVWSGVMMLLWVGWVQIWISHFHRGKSVK